MTFLSAISLLATVATLVLLIAPFPAVTEARQRGEFVTQTLLNTLFAQIFNTLLWSLYGVLISDLLIIAVNAIGAGFGLYFLTETITLLRELNGEHASTRYKIKLSVAFIAISATLVFLFKILPHEAMHALGIMASCSTVLLLAAPSSESFTIIQEEDSSRMPLLQVFVGFVSATMWSLYGSLVGNPYIWVPNVLGLAASVMQIWLVCRYSNFVSDYFDWATPHSMQPHGVPRGQYTGVDNRDMTRDNMVDDNPGFQGANTAI